jgi:hypothetical protein
MDGNAGYNQIFMAIEDISKTAFGVSAGEFLGFLVHEGGIEVGKKSMKAIDEFVPPTKSRSCNHCLARSIL